MKTVFFGSGEYVIPILKLLKDKFSLSLVVTTDQEGSLVNFCKQNKLTFFRDRGILSTDLIEKINPDIGIVASFGQIIPKKTIDLFPRGILNIHPSLLPQYRGPTPVQTALLNGDRQTGVTIIKLDEKVDHGGVLAQEEYEISSKDTAKSLHQTLFKLGANLLEGTLIDYLEENLEPNPQDDSLASMTKPLTRESGHLDLKTLKIGNLNLKIERAVRAFFPWPGVWFQTSINGKQTIVKLLPDNLIQVEGKKPQSYKDFINGYKEGAEIIQKLNLT